MKLRFGIHAIDFRFRITGTPKCVRGKIHTQNHQIETKNCAMGMLEYANDQRGIMQATTTAIPGFPEPIEIYRCTGSAIYHKGVGQLEWHFRDSSKDHVYKDEASNGAAQPMDISATAHTTQFKDFAEAGANTVNHIWMKKQDTVATSSWKPIIVPPARMLQLTSPFKWTDFKNHPVDLQHLISTPN